MVAPMLLFPKDNQEECPEYLEWIRSLRCLRGHWGRSEAHHQPSVGGAAMGMKVSDFRAVPLCPMCHAEYHDDGRLSFWGDVDFEAVILDLNLHFFLRSM